MCRLLIGNYLHYIGISAEFRSGSTAMLNLQVIKREQKEPPDATSDTLSILHFSPQNMVESLYVRWTYLIGDLQLGLIVFCVVLLLLDSTAHYQTMRFALPYTVRAKNSFWFVAYVWKVILIVCKSCFQCSNGIYWNLQKAACCTFLYWGLMWWN